MTRRLVGLIEGCGDPECDCGTPRIFEETEDRYGVTNRLPFWEGNFYQEMSRLARQEAEDELAAAAARHGLRREWGQNEVIYEREI